MGQNGHGVAEEGLPRICCQPLHFRWQTPAAESPNMHQERKSQLYKDPKAQKLT